MNNFRQKMMHEPNFSADTEHERPRWTERRFLVIALSLSYLWCLATLWYILNAPAQSFDTFWFQFGYNRSMLVIIPLVILCACYLRLYHIMRGIMGWSQKKLDERQRMVRDQAHRYAYKIAALLCLLVPLYLSLQNVFTPAKFTDFYNSFPVYPNVASQMICKSTVSRPTLCYSPPVPNTSLLLLMRMELLGARPNMGLYYVLLLLTMALIVWTLPKVIIAWKER